LPARSLDRSTAETAVCGPIVGCTLTPSGAPASNDARDRGLAVSLLGREPVVRSAEGTNVGGVVRAPATPRDGVVVFEPGAAVATGTIRSLPAASHAVPFDHRSTNCVW